MRDGILFLKVVLQNRSAGNSNRKLSSADYHVRLAQMEKKMLFLHIMRNLQGNLLNSNYKMPPFGKKELKLLLVLQPFMQDALQKVPQISYAFCTQLSIPILHTILHQMTQPK